MSRRCRAGLQPRGSESSVGSSLDSGCGCGRTGGISIPCAEPVIYGSNVLLDPGFETYPGIFGLNTGPSGETFPGEYSPGPGSPSPLTWADGQPYDGPLPAWAVFSNDGAANNPLNRFRIEVANPDTGIYHARFSVDGDDVTHLTRNASLSPLGFYMCRRAGEFGFGVNSRCPWAAIVVPGDLIIFSARAMANTIIDTPFMQLAVDTAAEDFSTGNQWPSFAFPEPQLTTSYETYTFSAFMPLGAHYLVPSITVDIDDLDAETLTHIDIDTVQLSLIQAGTKVGICSQFSLVTVDNSTTETDFL